MWLFLIVLVGIGILLPLLALVDALRSSNDKLIWVIVILFLNVIGALLYLVIGRNQRMA